MSKRSERCALPLLLLLVMLLPAQRLVAQTDPPADSAAIEYDSATIGYEKAIEKEFEEGDLDTAETMSSDSGSEEIWLDDSLLTTRFHDSSAMTARAPSSRRIDELRADDALRYDVEGHTPETIWDRIGAWLRELLGLAAGVPGLARVLEYTVYFILAAVLLLAIRKLLTTEYGGLILPGSAQSASIVGTIEDIHAVDFDRLVEEAIRARDFRGATRFLYLKGLRVLSERGLIDWRRDRMNHDYLRQLGTSGLADPFARCTLLFEYVWYGDFPVDEQTFNGIAGTIRGFIRTVESARRVEGSR